MSDRPEALEAARQRCLALRATFHKSHYLSKEEADEFDALFQVCMTALGEHIVDSRERPVSPERSK